MPNPQCAVCGKTAYPLESVTALDQSYHKFCFKCVVCQTTLNLKNFKGFEGKIYCLTHTPKVKASATTTDSFAVKTAMAAPKKASEGLSKVQKGTGEKPSVGLDTVVAKTAMSAPKKGTALGVHKADPRVAPQKSADFAVNDANRDQSTENTPDSSSISYDAHHADQSTENAPESSGISYDAHHADQSTENAPESSGISYDAHHADQSTENNPEGSGISYEQANADQSTESNPEQYQQYEEQPVENYEQQ